MTLQGCELSRSITVSYKLREMAVKDFIPYIQRKIAEQMGIGVRTFYKWQKKYPQIAQAVRKGRELVDYQVEQALLDRALGGDLRAQMYWLNNRRGDRWQEHPKEKEKEDGEDVTVVVDV